MSIPSCTSTGVAPPSSFEVATRATAAPWKASSECGAYVYTESVRASATTKTRPSAASQSTLVADGENEGIGSAESFTGLKRYALAASSTSTRRVPSSLVKIARIGASWRYSETIAPSCR